MTDQPARVPAQVQPTYDAIVALTDALAAKHLNDEYATLFRQLTAKLARKRPSPLLSGKPASWAAGIAHVIGRNNFLDDKSQDPHMAMSDLFADMGVSQGTGSAKSKQIRTLLKIHLMDPEWTLPSRIDQNPMVWILSVNGLLVDIRHMPREAQEVAYSQGLIPYIPADREAQAL